MPLESLAWANESFIWFTGILAQMVGYLETNNAVFGIPIGYAIIYFAITHMVIKNFINKGESHG